MTFPFRIISKHYYGGDNMIIKMIEELESMIDDIAEALDNYAIAFAEG